MAMGKYCFFETKNVEDAHEFLKMARGRLSSLYVGGSIGADEFIAVDGVLRRLRDFLCGVRILDLDNEVIKDLQYEA